MYLVVHHSKSCYKATLSILQYIKLNNLLFMKFLFKVCYYTFSFLKVLPLIRHKKMNLTQNPYPLAGKCSSFYKLQAVLGILLFKTLIGSYTCVSKGGLYHSFNGHDSV